LPTSRRSSGKQSTLAPAFHKIGLWPPIIYIDEGIVEESVFYTRRKDWKYIPTNGLLISKSFQYKFLENGMKLVVNW
jgi:hypothetical protein